MKPKLGRIVYCIYKDSILVQPVYAIAKDSFLLDYRGVSEDSVEWHFEDYNDAWFTSLAKEKKKLLDIFRKDYPNTRFKVVKKSVYYEDFYEIEEM